MWSLTTLIARDQSLAIFYVDLTFVLILSEKIPNCFNQLCSVFNQNGLKEEYLLKSSNSWHYSSHLILFSLVTATNFAFLNSCGQKSHVFYNSRCPFSLGLQIYPCEDGLEWIDRFVNCLAGKSPLIFWIFFVLISSTTNAKGWFKWVVLLEWRVITLQFLWLMSSLKVCEHVKRLI